MKLPLYELIIYYEKKDKNDFISMGLTQAKDLTQDILLDYINYNLNRACLEDVAVKKIEIFLQKDNENG